MRQRADMPRGARVAQGIADALLDVGDNALVNGAPINAGWARAQPGRIQMFLGELADTEGVYEVHFAGGAVLDAPYKLTVESRVDWVGDNRHQYHGVVRALDMTTIGGIIVQVTAIVQLVGHA